MRFARDGYLLFMYGVSGGDRILAPDAPAITADTPTLRQFESRFLTRHLYDISQRYGRRRFASGFATPYISGETEPYFPHDHA